MNRSRRNGVGLLLEGVVILISILAAFFLEGWRNDRELERELAQELASVEIELLRNRDLVVLERTSLRRVLDGGDGLVAALEEADGAFANVSDTLVWLGTSWNTSFSPSLGAVDALIASGRLAQVSNPELRLLLAGLRDIVADSFEEEQGARDVAVIHSGPVLAEFDFNAIQPIGRRFFASDDESQGMTPQERVQSKALVSSGTLRFPADLRVRNYFTHRMGWFWAAYSEFGSLERHLERMVALVAHERSLLPGGPAL